MSDLQMGLVALGVLLLLAVLLFNWWQERRVRQQMQLNFGQGQDLLLGEDAVAVSQRREPGFGAQASASSAVEVEAAEIDPGCEAVIDVSFAQPVAGLALREALEELLQRTDKPAGKPVRTLVIDPASTPGGDGRAHNRQGHSKQIRADEAYDAVQLVVLLANRQGALTAIDWSGVWLAAQQLAQRFDGAVEGPEQEAVLAQAQQLDAFCSGLDGQVVLTIKLPSAHTPAQFEALVRDAGLVMYGEDWVLMADSGLPWFALKMDGQEKSRQLSLVLDVPNCEIDDAAFTRMAQLGRTLAEKLHATLLNDQGQPVLLQSCDSIDAQLLKMRQTLNQAGFEPGSWRTLRLFA